MNTKTLIFVPTYNERDNAPKICREIMALGLDADVLFVDDNSPDGTGAALEELRRMFPRLKVQHREGKLGIGSAHLAGIGWAYQEGYKVLVTMDCDFTHSPEDIPRLLAALQGCDLAVGSRFLGKESLPGWTPLRKLMTAGGHFLTSHLLGMPQDASGAFRAYDLRRIDQRVFNLTDTAGYGFFFDSLFVIVRNKYRINEIPIVLPARSSGDSKMSFAEIWKGLSHLFSVAIRSRIFPDRYMLSTDKKV
jgi:dolichol-phosphate mannosyltransferase